MDTNNSFIISNSYFVNINSPFQNTELFKDYRTEDKDYNLLPLIQSSLQGIYSFKQEELDKLEYHPDYGVLVNHLEERFQTRKDKLCFPINNNLNINIYFYVDTVNDGNYMFNTIFTFNKSHPISFEMSPRETEYLWTEEDFTAMDKLGQIWFKNWTVKN